MKEINRNLEEKVINDYHNGLFIWEIARKYNITEFEVNSIIYGNSR